MTVLVLLNTMFATRGIQATARANFVFLGLQVAILAVFLVAAIAALLRGAHGATLSITPNKDATYVCTMIVGLGWLAIGIAWLAVRTFGARRPKVAESAG